MTSNLLMGFVSWWTALLTTLAIVGAYFLKKGYEARSLVNKLRRQHMMMSLMIELFFFLFAF
jgi:uncharacterized membrane protein